MLQSYLFVQVACFDVRYFAYVAGTAIEDAR